MFSKLFRRRRQPQTYYAQGFFLVLFAFFTVVTLVKPTFGLVGLGTLAILAAGVIELNSGRIWDDYRKAYKKQRHFTGMWHEPKEIYYRLNVYVLWPLVALSGALCLWVAYQLAQSY